MAGITSIMTVKPGVLDDGQKRALKRSGVMVIETDDEDAIRFVQSQPVVPVDHLVFALFESLADFSKERSGSESPATRLFQRLARVTKPTTEVKA